MLEASFAESMQPPKREVAAERDRKRMDASVKIQLELMRRHIEAKTGSAVPHIREADPVENGLAVEWQMQHAGDFRDRVMKDPDVLRCIDDGRINDAIERSAALLYEARREERPAA